MTEKLGFIGLGIMGGHMARHLSERFEVTVFDIDAEKVARVEKANPATSAASVGEVAVEVELDLTTGGQLVDTTKKCRALGIECLAELGVVVGHQKRLVALVLGLVRPLRS